jgi:hypothetical protein
MAHKPVFKITYLKTSFLQNPRLTPGAIHIQHTYGLRVLKMNSPLRRAQGPKETWGNPVGVEFEFEAKVFLRKTLASNRLSGKCFSSKHLPEKVKPGEYLRVLQEAHNLILSAI